MSHRVTHWSVGTPELYDLLRHLCPSGVELRLLETGYEQERLAIIAGTDAVVVAATRLSEAHVAAAAELRLVQHQVEWPA